MVVTLKPESKLWKLVKKNTEKNIHWTRIESWAGSGIPDLHGISDGIDVWVELKVTQSNHIRLSPFQHSWHFRHTLHGGRAFIMLQTLKQRLLYIFPSFLLHSPLPFSIASEPRLVIPLPASQAAWETVVDYLLHSPFSIASEPRLVVPLPASQAAWETVVDYLLHSPFSIVEAKKPVIV